MLEFTELTTADLTRMADLVEQYAGLGLGGTDASLVALAERLGIDHIATFDRRRFSVVRPAHVEAFTLLPTQPTRSRYPLPVHRLLAERYELAGPVQVQGDGREQRGHAERRKPVRRP